MRLLLGGRAPSGAELEDLFLVKSFPPSIAGSRRHRTSYETTTAILLCFQEKGIYLLSKVLAKEGRAAMAKRKKR